MKRPRFGKSAASRAMQAQYDAENADNTGYIFGGSLPEVYVDRNRIQDLPPEALESLYNSENDILYNPISGQGIVDPSRKALMEQYIYNNPGGLQDTMIYDNLMDSVYTSGHLPRMSRTPGFEQAVQRYENLMNDASYYSPSWRSRFKSALEFMNPVPPAALSNQQDVEVYYPQSEGETYQYYKNKRRAQEKELKKK